MDIHYVNIYVNFMDYIHYVNINVNIMYTERKVSYEHFFPKSSKTD